MNHKEFAEGYLLHKIPFDIVEALGLDRHPWLILPTMLVACYAVAASSWNLLEQPFVGLKRFFESTGRQRSMPSVIEAK